jgi:hypothetical protein
MNDLFLSSPTKEQRRLSISHASSQTDTSEPIDEINNQTNDTLEIIPPVELDRNISVTNEEAKAVLNELDTILDNSNQESPITPNSDINVVVVNPPNALREEVRKKKGYLFHKIIFSRDCQLKNHLCNVCLKEKRLHIVQMICR